MVIERQSHQPISPELLEQNPKVNRKLKQQRKIELYKKAEGEGFLASLTEKQQHILKIRGYPIGDVSRSFRNLRKEGCLKGISFQAASDLEVRAFRRLDAANNKLVMTSKEKELILEHQNLSGIELARWLRHSQETIGRWKKELGIPNKRPGPPKKVGESRRTID